MTIKNDNGNGFGPAVETARTEAEVMPAADTWVRKAFEDALLKARASEFWKNPPITDAEHDAFYALPLQEREDILNGMLKRVNYFSNDENRRWPADARTVLHVKNGHISVEISSI